MIGEFYPEKSVQSNVWTENHRQSSPNGLSGDSVAVEYGQAYWTVKLSIDLVPRSLTARQWSAFLKRREGVKNTFTMNRAFQSFPFNGGVTTDENLVIESASRANSTITLSGLEDTYQPEYGDMISFYTEYSGYYCGEVTQTATPSEGRVTLGVWPAPSNPHPLTPVPRRLKALAEFRLTKAPSANEAYDSRSFNIEAKQIIRSSGGIPSLLPAPLAPWSRIPTIGETTMTYVKFGASREHKAEVIASGDAWHILRAARGVTDGQDIEFQDVDWTGEELIGIIATSPAMPSIGTFEVQVSHRQETYQEIKDSCLNPNIPCGAELTDLVDITTLSLVWSGSMFANEANFPPSGEGDPRRYYFEVKRKDGTGVRFVAGDFVLLEGLEAP